MVWVARLSAEAAQRFPEKVTAFRQEMAVHGKFGEPCPRCGCFSFHSQTRFRNFSRPRSSRCLISPFFFNVGSTTVCVAMPAWSVPGSQTTSLPSMRALRAKNVLDGVVEGVPHREHARDVRRRDDDGIRRLGRLRVRDEKFSVQERADCRQYPLRRRCYQRRFGRRAHYHRPAAIPR